MTREEALQILSERDRIGVNIINANDTETTKYNNDSVEALSMAIAALKAEPCDTLKLEEMLEDAYEHGYQQARHDYETQPCDAVSREAVLGYVHRILNQGTGKKKSFEFIQKYVEKLPPVTPKQRIGKWIDDKCSVCGKGIEDLISSPEWYRNEEPNFCPYCGIKLEGE